MRPGFLILFLAYLGILVFFGLRFSRKMKGLEDFFLASRGLSAPLVFLSLTASWFGATSILVSVDEAYKFGISAFWVIGVPAVVTVLVFAGILNRPVRALKTLTLPDLMELRYGKAVRHIAAVLIVWYMALLAASQMVAAGRFLRLFLGVPYVWCLLLATVCVLVYSVAGGLFSVIMTDVVQCVLLACGMTALVFFLWLESRAGALSDASLEAGRRGYLDFFLDFKKSVLIALSFTLAWIISPIAWQRIQAAKSEKAARNGLLATAGGFVLLYGAVVLAGMLALPIFGGGELRNPLVAEIIASKAGTVLASVLFVAVAAAILSTMDTAINTGAMSLTRDVWQKMMGREDSGEAVAASRWAVLATAAAAFIVATRFESILKTIGLASEIMAEGFFIPGVAMLFLKKRAPAAGLLSLLFGSGFALAGFLNGSGALDLPIPAWPYSVPYGLALSLSGFLFGLFWERAKRNR